MADTVNADKTLFLPISGDVRARDLGAAFTDLMGNGVLGANPGGATVGDLHVSQRAAGANMSVDVAPGACWLQQEDGAAWPNVPSYRVAVNATRNLTLNAAHATLPRIDRVIVEVLDSTFAGVSNVGRLRVVAGTPAASPAAPAEPINSLTLATVAVAAAASITNANITDLREVCGPGSTWTREVPYFHLTRVGAFAVPNGAATDVPLDTVNIDTDRGGAASTSPITIRTSGYYIVTAGVEYVANATGSRFAGLLRNGAAMGSLWLPNAGAAVPTILTVSGFDLMNAGDVLKLSSYQNSGAPLNTGANTFIKAMMVHRTGWL